MKVLENNRNPLLVGKVFLEFLKETKVCPRFIRVDRGSETDLMVTIHGAIKDSLIKTAELSKPGPSKHSGEENNIMKDGDILDWSRDKKHVIYGSSVTNITIERFWRSVNEFIGAFFKPKLEKLALSHDYDSSEELDRKILSYIYIPAIQQEIDKFIYQYNSHRIRTQKGVKLPTGYHPNFCHRLPEQFGAHRCGVAIPEATLLEVESYWKLDEIETGVEISDPLLRNILNRFAPDPLKIDLHDLSRVFKDIKKEIEIIVETKRKDAR